MPPRGTKRTTSARRGRGGKSRSNKPPPPAFHPDEKLDMLGANGEVVGHASVFFNPDGKLPTFLHCHRVSDLRKKAKPGEHYVVIQVMEISPSYKDLKYPFHMKGADVPGTFGQMYSTGMYIWDAYHLRRSSGVRRVEKNDAEGSKSHSNPPLRKKARLDRSSVSTAHPPDGPSSSGVPHTRSANFASSSKQKLALPPRLRSMPKILPKLPSVPAISPQPQLNTVSKPQSEVRSAPSSPVQNLTSLTTSGMTKPPPASESPDLRETEQLSSSQPLPTPSDGGDSADPQPPLEPSPTTKILTKPPPPLEPALSKPPPTTRPFASKSASLVRAVKDQTRTPQPPPKSPVKNEHAPTPAPRLQLLARPKSAPEVSPTPQLQTMSSADQNPPPTSPPPPEPLMQASKSSQSASEVPASSTSLSQSYKPSDATGNAEKSKDPKQRRSPASNDAAAVRKMQPAEARVAEVTDGTRALQASLGEAAEKSKEEGEGNDFLRRLHNDGTTFTEETNPDLRSNVNDAEFTDEEQDRLPSMVEDEALIVEEDDEDQEDEGDEIKVPDTSGRGTYRKTRIRVRIDQLVYPPNLTRDLDMSHVGKLKTSMRKGIEYSLGHISVCHKPSALEFTPLKYDENKFNNVDLEEEPAMRKIDGQEKLSLKAYFVANGMHRGTAIDRIFREVKTLQDRQEFGVISVILYSRTDRKEISFYELLALGGAANDIGTISKPPTFADQIYLCVSCLKEILELNPDINITAAGVGKKFRQHSIVRASANGTHTKYGHVALTFVRHPEVYKRFLYYWRSGKAGEKFRVSHFQTKSFHTLFTEMEQLLILDALYEFLRHTSNSYFTSPAATRFYIECRQLFNVIRQIAQRMELPTQKILQEQVAVTKQDSVALSRFFIRTITCFLPTDKPVSMAKKSAARVTRFRNILQNTFFPKTEEEKEKEAEEKKKKEDQKKQQAKTRSRLARAAKTHAITATNAITSVLKSPSSKRVTGKRKRKTQETPQTCARPILRFDDSVPGRYPVKYASRPPKWIGTKEWVRLLNVPSHRVWSKDMCILYPEPWLHGMGVPRKHRSHLFLTAKDLERNHHAVYYHAALQAALQPAIAKNTLYDSDRTRKENARTRALRIASEYPDLGQDYLASCREQVMNKGYCLVEGIFDDTGLPSGPVKTVYEEKPASNVVEYYLNQFPTEEDIRNTSVHNKFWEPTFNTLENVQETGRGRFVTRKDGLYAGTENASATVEIARYRSALEIRALQICVAMNLEETGKGMLAIPCTGCRLFTSTENCERQVAHAGFGTKAGARDTFTPSDTVDYSVLWTADDAFPIVLWEYSHVLQSGTQAASRKIAQTAEARRIVIPPFSCLIMRGDMVYAAPGWQDQTLVEKEAMKRSRSVRFHMYICRWGLEKVDRDQRVTDAPAVSTTVGFIDKFQPKVQSNASWLTKAPSN